MSDRDSVPGSPFLTHSVAPSSFFEGGVVRSCSGSTLSVGLGGNFSSNFASFGVIFAELCSSVRTPRRVLSRPNMGSVFVSSGEMFEELCSSVRTPRRAFSKSDVRSVSGSSSLTRSVAPNSVPKGRVGERRSGSVLGVGVGGNFSSNLASFGDVFEGLCSSVRTPRRAFSKPNIGSVSGSSFLTHSAVLNSVPKGKVGERSCGPVLGVGVGGNFSSKSNRGVDLNFSSLSLDFWMGGVSLLVSNGEGGISSFSEEVISTKGEPHRMHSILFS